MLASKSHPFVKVFVPGFWIGVDPFNRALPRDKRRQEGFREGNDMVCEACGDGDHAFFSMVVVVIIGASGSSGGSAAAR